MERVILIFTILILPVFYFLPSANAEEVMSMSTLVTPHNMNLEDCNKLYRMPSEKLFYMTIAGINANRFSVDELQSKTGYILFTAVGKQFLASVVKIDNNRSMLKITPADNVYYFQPGIVLNLFKYIDVNSLEPLAKIPACT